MVKGSEAIKLVDNNDKKIGVSEDTETLLALSFIEGLKNAELLSEREYKAAKKRSEEIKRGM